LLADQQPAKAASSEFFQQHNLRLPVKSDGPLVVSKWVKETSRDAAGG
jgi:hypothetical protein